MAMAEEKYFDERAVSRLDKIGGSNLIGQMIDLFLDNVPKRLEAARTAHQNGKLKDLERAAHSIKSSASNFGAQTLCDIAETIEIRAGEQNESGMAALLDKMEETFAKVKTGLEEKRKGLQE